MTVEAVGFIPPDANLDALAGLGRTQSGSADFAAWIDRQLAGVDARIQTGETLVRQLATGETSNIHHVMLALEKAKVSFELVTAVRNKVLEAYQEVMRMQL